MAALTAKFEPYLDEIPAARRSLAQAGEAVDVCKGFREAYLPGVRQFLTQQAPSPSV